MIHTLRRRPYLGLTFFIGLPLLTFCTDSFGAKKKSTDTSAASVPVAALPVGKAQTVERLEASVNSSLILLSDVVQFRKTLPLRGQLDPLFSGNPLSKKPPQTISDSQIVDFLISDRVISEQFPIKDAEVEQEINSIQATNRIDRKSLKAALKEQGFAFEDYFQLIKTSLSKRNLIDRDIRTKVFISDDDVKNHFYNRLQEAGKTSFSYHIQIITLSPANYKAKSGAFAAAQEAMKALRGGESFTEVAKRASDDPSASSGGDLGMLNEDEISPQIKQAVRKLKVGELSGILGSESTRFFILKLADIKSGDEDKLAKAKEEIRGELMTVEYQHQIELWMERQRLVAYVRLAGASSLTGLHGQ